MLALAFGVSQLPALTAQDAGASPQALAPPLIALAFALCIPRVRRALSQRRALAVKHPLKARVAGIEDLRSGSGVRRFRFSWADGRGRVGRSLVQQGRWLPPVGSWIVVHEDPANGVQWWDGDMPGFPPEAIADEAASPLTATRNALYVDPFFILAAFTGAIASLFLLSGAPALLWILLAGGAYWSLSHALTTHRARERAFRMGPRIQAKVIARRAVSSGASVSLEWESREGHFGETNAMAASDAPNTGANIWIRVDPLTRLGWWEGEAAKATAQRTDENK